MRATQSRSCFKFHFYILDRIDLIICLCFVVIINNFWNDAEKTNFNSKLRRENFNFSFCLHCLH